METKLAIGTTTEEMQALYFNATQLHEPSYKLWQLNAKGKRYYYRYEGNDPIFYPSVTTILHNVMPENKYLTEWKLNLGKDKATEYTMERASYGSFIHGQLAELMIARTYNLDDVRDRLTRYAEKEKLASGFIDAHEEEAKADIKAFAKWMQDYDVRPYAVEVALYSPSMGVAGMIDCVCNLRTYSRSDERKDIEKASGDEKKLAKIAGKAAERINAIVDFKSGKKGFYDEYAIQLELYRRMWNENFPDTPIERIFNIAPKDWLGTVKKVPSYSFEEQTENPILAKVDLLVSLYKLSEEEEKKVVLINGIIDLDKDDESNVQVFTLAELIKSHKVAENAPQEEISSEEEF